MNIVTQNKIMKDALRKLSMYGLTYCDPSIDKPLRRWAHIVLEKCVSNKVFSGPNSEIIWDCINDAKTIDDVRRALYSVCCRIQELESKYDKMLAKLSK